jgi:hypothetical protein
MRQLWTGGEEALVVTAHRHGQWETAAPLSLCPPCPCARSYCDTILLGCGDWRPTSLYVTAVSVIGSWLLSFPGCAELFLLHLAHPVFSLVLDLLP